MIFSFPGAYPNQHIHLTFKKESFINPDFVLVYAFYKERLLFTHHKDRGWELPGGIRHPNEWPINAAIREVYEETGAELSSLEPIGQYTMFYPHRPDEVKTIYIAQIRELHPLPLGFETDEIQLLNPPPSPEKVLADSSFSLLLKDGVYRFSLPMAMKEMRKLSTIS